MLKSLASSLSSLSSIGRDAKVLWNLAKPGLLNGSHAQRLEHFYAGQASQYDEFRKRLLHGRSELFSKLHFPDDGVWVDLGSGTGENVERIGASADRLSQMHWVDLSPSLLNVARQRANHSPWKDRIHIHEADVTDLNLGDGFADVVSMSYSLTMIPDWFSAIETAARILKPGGQFGMVDFFVSRKYPAIDEVKHGPLTRYFWPIWFGWDNVYLSPDHLPMLRRHFETLHLFQARSSIPYLPLLRAPYYYFVGTKPKSLDNLT